MNLVNGCLCQVKILLVEFESLTYTKIEKFASDGGLNLAAQNDYKF